MPDELKDDKYWARRRKNNIAAKRSRDARRQKENQIAMRARYLEKEVNFFSISTFHLNFNTQYSIDASNNQCWVAQKWVNDDVNVDDFCLHRTTNKKIK